MEFNKLVNVSEGTEQLLEITAEEKAQQELKEAKEIARKQKEADKLEARNALFERLGISEEEAKLLLS